MNKRVLVLAPIIIAAMAGISLFSALRHANPRFEWKTVETDTYVASYPSHWERTDFEVNPKLGRRYMQFRNRPLREGDDRTGRSLEIDDTGIKNAPAARIIEEMRARAVAPRAVRELVLSNGVTAQTWIQRVGMNEMSVPVRWYVFVGTNGRIYKANHDVPEAWSDGLRYNKLFLRILGSMKFKDPPPANK